MDTSKLMDKEKQELMNASVTRQPPRLGEEESSSTHFNGEEDFFDDFSEFVKDCTITPKDAILFDNHFESLQGLGSSIPPSTSSSTGPTAVFRSERVLKPLARDLKNASLEPQVIPEVTPQGERTVSPSCSVATVTEIGRTVKKYTENLLHALEGVTARLSQLESRTQHIESSMDDLKLFIGKSFLITEGKMLPLENILHEVQSGVQILRDKQEKMETGVHLSKLQLPQSQPQSKPSSDSTPTAPTCARGTLALPFSLHQLPPQASQSPPQAPPQQPSSLPTLNAPHPPQNQNPSLPALYASPQHPPQISQPASPSVHSAHQQSNYQLPQSQPQPHPQSQPRQGQPHSSKYGPYFTNATPQPLTVESNHPNRPPRAQCYSPHGPTPYIQPAPHSGSLPPAFDGPSSFPPFGDGPAQTNWPGYGSPVDSYTYGDGSPSNRPGGMKTNSPFASGSAGGGADKYENLPTAKLLPLAATPVGAGFGSQNLVPLDDVMEKFVMMGFSQEQVRETVRQLTEIYQNVDVDMVMAELMNGDTGWFNF